MSRPPLGAFVALAIGLLVAGGFAALFSAAGGPSTLAAIAPYLTRILAFSLSQAAISAVLSLALGAALALALARRRFPGRRAAISALGAASVMPAIVVVFAVVAVYGQGGFIADAARALGFEPRLRIFGWPGILIAHVFFNAPFVARVYLGALAAVPAEQWRLAQTLGFGPREILRHLDWPVIKAELPGLASLVFLLCFTSFAIVLTLGGGGGRATLEVAIFEALRVDLDFGRAAWLGLVQVAICAGVALVLHRLVTRPPATQTVRAGTVRPDAGDPRLKVLDGAVLLASGLLVGPPLASLASGLAHLPAIVDSDFVQALVTSIVVATISAAATCLMALALATAARHERLRRRRPKAAVIYDVLPAVVLALPPFALTAGLFLVIRRFGDPALAGYLLLPLMNALGALPFAYRFIAPPVAVTGERYGRLADLLGMRGANRLAIVDWPMLRRPLAAALAMSAALSFGDFGVIALFGGRELRTLPYLLYERLGSYRLEEASAISLVLVLIALALAYAASRWSDAPR